MLIVKNKPHKLPEKQLRLILNLLKDAFEENGDAPSDGVDFFENYLNIVDDALKYVNMTPDDIEDYSFVGELYFLNKDNDSSSIIRPTPKVFNVYHKETRTETVINNYKQTISSYMDLDESILLECQSMGMYEYWDGNHYDTDYLDTDYVEDEIGEIIKMKNT
jgi:hypothetical protein